MSKYFLEPVYNFIVGGIVTLFTWYFGSFDDVFQILVALAVVDYLSGTCAAWYQKNIKKCIMFTFVGIANLIDKVMPGNAEAIKLVVCLFYIGNEGMSIIENADRIGIPIPKFIRERFITMRDENNIPHHEHLEKDIKL